MNSTSNYQSTLAKEKCECLSHTKMALNYIMGCSCDTGISVYPGM